ncbi:MAG TPA: glutamine synthetase family protein [Stellaceae bacterium]|nr:glutamine synthetase family protein [Stellaceae bacterium]
MIREELVFVATCDISGHARGKGFPLRELPGRLRKGIGWTGSNLMMSPSGPIWDTPFGTVGDLMIVPDPAAQVRVDFADGSAVEHFFLGDIRVTDGEPWECCPRDFLRRAARELEEAAGLRLVAAFEQEFVYSGADDRPGDAYGLGAFRRQGAFGEAFIAALRTAGPVPDSFLAEYGPRQFEVTVAPQPALAAADHAVITREMARAVADRLGHRVTFSPKPDPDRVGNGVHIHMSLWDGAGRPATHMPGETMDLSPPAQHFFAGVLHHMPAICAVSAPSPVSYLRLVPNAWAPTLVDLVRQDRGASLRVCPVFAPEDADEAARQFNVEFRVCDAAASPYLALGMVIFGGVDGIRQGLQLPVAAGNAAASLPTSLDRALDHLAASETAARWFGPTHFEAYMRFKRVEAEKVASLSPAELCAHYAEIY